MDVVTELTMATNLTFNSILNEIQLSKLNFSKNVTPYVAYITLKKSTQVDMRGNHLAPPLMLLQQSNSELDTSTQAPPNTSWWYQLALKNRLKYLA